MAGHYYPVPPTYKIVRMFHEERNSERRAPRVIKRGLTIDEARAHCRNPESSSRTATSARAKRYTAQYGAWFDGYEAQR